MKITDWACTHCLKRHAKILASRRKESARKHEKIAREKNKAARAELKMRRKVGSYEFF